MELNIENIEDGSLLVNLIAWIPRTEDNARKLEKIIDSKTLTFSEKIDIVTYSTKFENFS